MEETLRRQLEADLLLAGVKEGFRLGNLPEGSFKFGAGPDGSISLNAGRTRDALAGTAWFKDRIRNGFRPEECLGRRTRCVPEFIGFTRRWRPVYKQCMDTFPMADPDIRRLAELGATGLLNGWCEGITFYFNELLPVSEIFPDLISEELRQHLRAIWEERAAAARRYDLDLWRLVRAPMGTGGHVRPRELINDRVHENFIKTHPELFGYSPVDQISNPMCLGRPEVRDFYREVYRKTAAEPGLKGFLIWLGDGNLDICRCGKCAGGPEGILGAWAAFISFIHAAVREVNPETRFLLINWHCLFGQDKFRRLMKLLPPDIGVVIPKTGNRLEMSPAEYEARGLKGLLNQPFLLKHGWSLENHTVLEQVEAMGRPYALFDSYTAGEDTNPAAFFPAPATVAAKILEAARRQPGPTGLFDFWGLNPDRLEVNEIALQEALWHREGDGLQEILVQTARRRFALASRRAAEGAAAAWQELDRAFQEDWQVVSFGQRLENCFVGWRDATFPSDPPAHEHEGFSAGPVTGDLVARIPATGRFRGAGRELAYFTRLGPAAFLRRSQGNAARALRIAGRQLKKSLGREARGRAVHLDFLENAAVHFATMAGNFEALEKLEMVRGGRLKAETASRRLAKLAGREIKAWEWVREFVDRYGLQNHYWPNELDRRLQLQREWAAAGRWLKFFRAEARSRAGQSGPGAPEK